MSRAWIGQEIGDAGDPLVDLAAEGSTVRGAGGLDVLESDGLTGVLRLMAQQRNRLRWNTLISARSRGS